MRSNKNLKSMVKDNRSGLGGISSANVSSIREDVEGEHTRNGRSGYDTQQPGSAQDEGHNFVRNEKVGKANYATAAADDDTLKKLRKLEVLAKADKETIDAQKKTMNGLRAEHEALKQKYGQLKRNYDSVSLHAKKDAAANKQIQDMKEAYEKQINELTAAKTNAENELSDTKVTLTGMEARAKEHVVKLTQQTKELENLKKELARQQKGFDSQMAAANAGNKGMYEEKIRMSAELKKLKAELAQLVGEKADLTNELNMSKDSQKHIGMLKEKLAHKDEQIQLLNTAVGNLKGEVYDSANNMESMRVQLENVSQLLSEARDSMKALQIERSSLQQENNAKDVQIKNLLLELKLTKEAAGDKGSQIGEMSKALREAQESATRWEGQASEILKTLETRTSHMLKEKADLKKQLDKALEDMKKRDGNSNDIDQLNKDLRSQVETLKKQLSDSEMQLEIIHDQIADKIEKILISEKEKTFAQKQLEKMTQEVKEIKESEEILQQHLETTEGKLRKEQTKNDKMMDLCTAFSALHEKMKVGFQPIESTLSCLSCLEYLKEPKPHTLVCGHSICANCFNQHSDPSSQDSLVFCEECKIETKNKQLRDSKVMQILASKFNTLRIQLASMQQILGRV